MSNPEFAFVPRKLGQSSRNRGGGYSQAQDASASATTKNLKVARKLSKSSKHDAATILSEPTQHVVTSESSLTIPPLPLEDDKTKKGKYLDDKVYTILFELTLSDYSLWSNQGLLQAIEADEEGFIPISYLAQVSPYFIGLGLDTIPPESILIRSVRGSGMLEGRLRVSNGVSLRDRFGKTRRDLDVLDERDGMGMGLGFEVRRKDWVDMGVRDRLARYSKFYWESRSVYVENLPYRTRSFHTIYDFIQQLLPRTLAMSDSDDSAPILSPRIQNISFPPHHKDSPDAPVPTTGKGFAFIVLSSPKDVDYITQRWPWEVDGIGPDLKSPDQRLKCQKSKSELVEREGGEDERVKVVREAMEYGFRCLSKRKWDEMKEEYLALQRRLLEETLAANESAYSTSNYAPPNPSVLYPRLNDMDEQQAPSTVSSKSKSKLKSNTITRGVEEPSLPLPPPPPHPHSSSPPDWFPKNCLVFIKNVHPETNKTCLRTLFASAFDMDVSAIDYVDYNKGLDSCYIRLSHPTHARTLIDYFSKHLKVQKGALDSISPVAEPLPSSYKNKTSTPITIELVQGKKEELYWEKIPEKVRKDALGRLGLNKADVDDGEKRGEEKGKGKERDKNETGVEDGVGRKRKRRK